MHRPATPDAHPASPSDMHRPSSARALALAAAAYFLTTALAVVAQDETTYSPSEYSLHIQTSDGTFCMPAYLQDDSQVIACSANATTNYWAAFGLVPQNKSYFFDQLQTNRPMILTPKPGFGTPYGLLPGGMLGVNMQIRPAPITLHKFSNGPVIDPEIPFVANGTDYFIMQAGGRLCTTKELDELEAAVVVCDMDPVDIDTVTQFRVSPLGWSWNYHRVQLMSAVNKQPCGNVFFQEEPQPIICPDHADEIEGFRSAFSINVMAEDALPMRTGAEFGMQTWIQFNLPIYYWKTQQNGSVVAAPPPQEPLSLAPVWQEWGLKLELLNTTTADTPISVGDEVLLKSTTTQKYCKVGQKLNRITCNSNKKDVKKALKKHTFIYNEFIPR